MSAEDVSEYHRGIEEPKRSTLEALRRTILEVVPDAEQVISFSGRPSAAEDARRETGRGTSFRDPAVLV